MVARNEVDMALTGLRAQFDKFYQENPHDGFVILDYLRVYNRRLYEVGLGCVTNYKDERELTYHDAIADLSEVDQRTAYHAGVLLGKLVFLNWALGSTLDLWDSRYDFNIEGEWGLRANDHVVIKNRLYEDAVWLERLKRPEQQAELIEFYNSEEDIKIRMAKDIIAHAEVLQKRHSEDPIFNIDCYRTDYFLMNGVLVGKRSASGWLIGMGWEYWEE